MNTEDKIKSSYCVISPMVSDFADGFTLDADELVRRRMIGQMVACL
jgi:hypothetical protein